MPPISRRKAISAGSILGGAGLLVLLDGQGKPPTAAWVRERLWGENLLAYEVWDGAPRAVLCIGNRVQYDLMIPGDCFWPDWPPAPQWQLLGLGYSIGYSDAPATAGFAPCVGMHGERCGRAVELLRQVNDPGIVAMGVLVDGAWRSYLVAAPGYAIQVDGLTGPPEKYRWLDAGGRVIRELADLASTKPRATPDRRMERYERRSGRRSADRDSMPGRSAEPRGLFRRPGKRQRRGAQERKRRMRRVRRMRTLGGAARARVVRIESKRLGSRQPAVAGAEVRWFADQASHAGASDVTDLG